MNLSTKISILGASVLLGATVLYFYAPGEESVVSPEERSATAASPVGNEDSRPIEDAMVTDTRTATPGSGLLADMAERLLRGPKGASEEQQRMKQEFGALYSEWDVHRFESMFAKAPPPHVMEERIDWFRDRLGACGPGAVMNVRDELRARFSYDCEGGRLEAEFTLDEKTRLLAGVAMGARGIDPVDAAIDAADEALLLTSEWSNQRFLQTFNDKFDIDKMKIFFESVRATYGACKRRKTLLASARGALFEVKCERGERTMKIELNDADKIRAFKLTEPPSPDAQADGGGM